MPNWCANSTTLVFPTSEEAQEFKDHITAMEADEEAKDENGNSLSLLGFFVPEPKYNDTGEWYWWRVNNWGTKWDIGGDSIDFYDEDDDRIELHFDTAWSPPDEIYQVLRDRYEDIEISWFYREDGMQFAGYLDRSW